MRLAAVPRPADLAEYKTASDEIEQALSRLPGCVAVYRTGGVSAPGISDIDRIVVLEGAGPVDEVWPELSERTRELAMHTPFAVDVDVFRRHRELAHVEPLEAALGSPLEVAERPHPTLFSLLLGAEGATVLLLQLAKTHVVGTAKIRPLLCLLHGLRHDLVLAGLAERDAPAAWQMAEAVAALRSDWFERPDATTEFRALLSDAPAAVGAALDAMATRATPLVVPGRRSLQLHAPWRRARVRAADATSVRATIRAFPRGRRAGEVAWRVFGADIGLPEPLIALLAGDVAGGYADAMAQRRILAAEYARRRPPGYGALGFAPIFVT